MLHDKNRSNNGKNIMKFTMTITLVAMAVITLSGNASGSTLKAIGDSRSTCTVSDFTIGDSSASGCEGAFGGPGTGGNDSNVDLDGLFGQNAWTEIVKLDGSSVENAGEGLTLSVFLTDGSDEKSGTWSVSSWGGYKTVMAILKGGPTFSAYKLDTTLGTKGTWTTNGIRNGNGNGIPGLSHMTFYHVGSPIGPPRSEASTGPSPVPLPAAGWLLLAGLCGLVALRRR
jgi:hypothetical protein